MTKRKPPHVSTDSWRVHDIWNHSQISSIRELECCFFKSLGQWEEQMGMNQNHSKSIIAIFGGVIIHYLQLFQGTQGILGTQVTKILTWSCHSSCGCGRRHQGFQRFCASPCSAPQQPERDSIHHLDHLGVSEMKDTEKNKKWCFYIYRVAYFFGQIPFLDKLICLRKTSQRKPTINTCSDLLLRLLRSIVTDEIIRLVFTHVASGQ